MVMEGALLTENFETLRFEIPIMILEVNLALCYG